MRLVRRSAAAALLALAACGGGDGEGTSALPPGMRRVEPENNAAVPPPPVPFSPATPRVAARAVASWPHDTMAYTQGLLVHGGRLLESTGIAGQSDVREVDLASGRAVRRTPIPRSQFGEGIAVLGGRMYHLTWTGGRGHVYDAATLAPVDSFTYEGEGWGLATDGRALYMSDGTSRLRVVDPAGFLVQRTIQVTEAGNPVHMLNELEWVRGELWANIYNTTMIARIDPATGNVVGWVDVAGLLGPQERQRVDARGGVANGIAYDSTRNRLLVTGKYWPRLFEVELPGKP